MLTEDRIVAAYNQNAIALNDLAQVVENLKNLKNTRAVELAQKVDAGLYEGCKNEDQRKAAAAAAFQATDAIIKSLEAGERAAQLALDLASNETDCVKALLHFRFVEEG